MPVYIRNNGSWDQVSGGGGGSGGGSSGDKIEEGNTKAEVIDTGSDGHFLVETEGTERLRIIANGNVGIGSTIPIAKLDVNGLVAFGSSIYDANGNVGTSGQVLSSVPGIGVSWTDQTGSGSGGNIGVSTTRILTVGNGTHTFHSDLLYAKVWMLGGGGGGGGGTAQTGNGGDGGGGCLAYRIYTAAEAGTTATYTIGGGGAAGVDPASAAAGGNSTFTVTGTLSATVLTAGGGGLGKRAANGGADGAPGLPTNSFLAFNGEVFDPNHGGGGTGFVPGVSATAGEPGAMYIEEYYSLGGSGGGGGGTLTGIAVSFDDYNCSYPIRITTSAGISTIGIGSTSNAYGNRFIGTETPATSCNGDIWFDTSDASSPSGISGTTPIGGIIIWSGTIASLSSLSGWVLCDGQTSYTNILGSTVTVPDLRGQFIVGAADDSVEGTFSNNVGVGSTGGSVDSSLVSHDHMIAAIATPGAGLGAPGYDYLSYNNNAGATGEQYLLKATNTSPTQGKTSTAGSSATNTNLPPYYALAYIIRVS